MTDRISEIKERLAKATPGPWMWDMAESNHECALTTTHSGRYYVMTFKRWGMNSAEPEFQTYEKYTGPVRERNGKGMNPAHELSKSYSGKEHHKGFDNYIDHPDAELITHAPADIDYLLTELANRDAEIERLREAQRWIPLTERKPTKEDAKNTYGDVMWLVNENNTPISVALPWHEFPRSATHWHLLPVPPANGGGKE